jgi:hypothetical protein
VSIRNRAVELCRHRAGNGSFISRSCDSEDTAQTREGLLRTGDGARRVGMCNRNRRTLHIVGGRHKRFAGEIAHDEIQGLDAKCTRALVVSALLGIGNLCPLVRTAFVSKVKSRSLAERSSSAVATKGGINS